MSLGQTKKGYQKEDSVIIDLENKKIKLVLKEIYPFPKAIKEDSKGKFAKFEVIY